MNAKKIKALRRIVCNSITERDYHSIHWHQNWVDSLGATPKQISRAFDVVLKVRSPILRHGLSEDIKAFTDTIPA
jgi:hypothetical protein